MVAPNQGRHGACPYEDNDAVDVVGHHDKGIHIYTVVSWQLAPHGLHHLSRFGQDHPPVDNAAEHAFAILRADRHEIRAGLRVVESRQPD